jgi:hypothetical protein
LMHALERRSCVSVGAELWPRQWYKFV